MKNKTIDPDMFIKHLLGMCQEPMTLVDLSKKMQMSYSTVYKYMKILEENHKVDKTLDKSTGTKKFWYQTANEFSSTPIRNKRFMRDLPKPKESDGHETKHKITDHGVITRNGSSTIVRGFDGYHPKNDRSKVRVKYYVGGGSLEMV